ncbi:MAG: type II toxin-antitoxin system RelE/ParE family toxin [Planctomycetes bacterium]|nr:type II toxin-antitoxin system RelE/ParE family toxin [Planctomycetota bacterium]
MTGRATWHRLAEEDLAEAYLHIGSDSAVAAERLLDAVEHAITLLLSRPRAGRAREFRSPRAFGLRSWVVSGFENYLIFYRPRPEGIEVVRFIHGARDIPSLLEEDS